MNRVFWGHRSSCADWSLDHRLPILLQFFYCASVTHRDTHRGTHTHAHMHTHTHTRTHTQAHTHNPSVCLQMLQAIAKKTRLQHKMRRCVSAGPETHRESVGGWEDRQWWQCYNTIWTSWMENCPGGGGYCQSPGHDCLHKRHLAWPGFFLTAAAVTIDKYCRRPRACCSWTSAYILVFLSWARNCRFPILFWQTCHTVLKWATPVRSLADMAGPRWKGLSVSDQMDCIIKRFVTLKIEICLAYIWQLLDSFWINIKSLSSFYELRIKN